ncbi:MAG: PDZ domain-containing protein, partial [Cyclobacteriaceae bacterium]|nr:PDZ domain-containing protein [Cyclobacteriaceae bacterium]
LPYGNSDDVEVGEWVLAVGNPFNLASTVTAGIVSAKARNINILRDREAIESFIQTDAAVNPGNSGGALVNLDGQLIGINAAIATPTGAFAGYSFAIPVNIVKKVADDLLQFGSVQRGYLGIMIRDMTGSLAKDLDLKFTPGVYVDSLVQDGAAAEAGLKQGDIITKIDGAKVESSPQLQEIVARHRPGEKLLITFNRKGQEKNIPVVLKATSGTVAVSRKSSEAVLEMLGIDVSEITARQKKQLGIQHGLEVTRIVKGKVSEFTTMKEGFIITRINNIPVKSKDDLADIISKKGGVLIEGVYPGSKEVIYYGVGI